MSSEAGGGANPHKRSASSDKSQKSRTKKDVAQVKRKPLITESDSDDDSYPPPPKRAAPAPPVKQQPETVAVKEEKPTPTEAVVNSAPQTDRKKKRGKSKSAGSSSSAASKAQVKVEDKVSAAAVTSSSTSESEAGSKAKAGVKRVKKENGDGDDDDEEFKPKKARKTAASKEKTSAAAKKPKEAAVKKGKAATVKKEPASTVKGSPVKKGKKKEEEKEVWKWWEEEPHPDGVKWLTLEHCGPFFAPQYTRLPDHVKFSYDGKVMKLSEGAEEAATFFAKMLDHDYTKKDVFCTNFFADWRKEMTPEEAKKITDLKKCDFSEIHQYFMQCSEERKAMTKEQKLKVKEENEKILAEYGWAIIDGHRERIGNFKTEPPGLFRGRGDHPKQGKIKRRVQPEDVTINIGKGAPVPPPPPGHRWKKVQHDNKVTWLAMWVENIQGQIKYVMLNPTSRLKGEKDWAKYETARKLKGCVDKIQRQYSADLKSREMRVRQRSVAMYFIDKLALRAGNEKDPDEAADTVGCCSLRVEHIRLNAELDGQKDVVEFDFLGKDSIRYYNRVPVEHQVFKNLLLFVENKEPDDELFDRLNTTILNKYLSELMPGLTAKVFRTFNASKTLQEQLEELTDEDASLPEKLLAYNRANRAVAVLCNHQRAPPKSFDQQMSNLQAKIQAKEQQLAEMRKELKSLRKEAKDSASAAKKFEAKKKQVTRTEEQLAKLEVQATDKEENKEIALGTSKLNYLDPRITVSWCKRIGVPVEKIYNRSQREKFSWAIDMADETFVF